MKCPCGKALSYRDCCQLLHRGIDRASSAEQLMRSRFSAFAMAEYQYLIDTHHPDTRGSLSVLTLFDSNKSIAWLGLNVLSATAQAVSFQAYFQSIDKSSDTSSQAGEIQCLHEHSRFAQEHGQWYYIDGEYNPKLAVLPGRKEPCFCGSGKKFKHCHGKQA